MLAGVDGRGAHPSPDGPPFAAAAAGLTRAALARHRRVLRGVYAPAGADDLLTRARAALVAIPDGVLSHHTAAALLRLPHPPSDALHVTRAAGRACSERREVVTHRRDLPPGRLTVVHGLPVTDPATVFGDLAAAGLGADELVAVADAVARRTGLPALRDHVALLAGQRGAARARAALLRCDPRSGSPAESLLRVAAHRLGFTGLVPGVVVRDEHGQWLAEPDLGDEEAQVAVQYEGAAHARWERHLKDIQRDEVTREAGWHVVLTTRRDLRDESRLARRLATAYDLAATLARGRSGAATPARRVSG